MAAVKRLAYVCNHFPALTVTFIYREVFELNRIGIPVKLYSIRRPEKGKMSAETAALYDQTSYLLPVSTGALIANHLRTLVRNPLRYIATIWRMITPRHASLHDRFRSLMHFGEGVVLANWMINDRIGHIHAHFATQSTSVSRVVHLLTGIPYSFTAHAYDIWRDRLLIPHKVHEAAFVATCSEKGRKELVKQIYGSDTAKVHLVYHGLDAQKFVPPSNENDRSPNRILSIGRLTGQKGFRYLIDACSILQRGGLSFECIIIGEGDLRRELEKQIQDLGLGGTVHLQGMVPQERIRQYYHSSWVFALPCIDTDDGNRDGIPNVLMEAMACGLPVVTTDNSGQTELIQNERHGILVPPRDPVRLAEAIRRLCVEPELRKKIQVEARRRMERDFDSRTTTMELVRLFQRHCPDIIDKTGNHENREVMQDTL